MPKRSSPTTHQSSSSSLTPPPETLSNPTKRARKSRISTKPNKDNEVPEAEPVDADEFQQITLPSFVNLYRVNGLGRGGDVFYQPDFIGFEEATKWYSEVLNLNTYQPMLRLYGRSFPQSRHIAAYSTKPHAELSYSGTKIIMHHPFPPPLEAMKDKLEAELGVRFNHCMLNRYDDGSVYIGRHSDNLNNLVIASISLGVERTFILSPRLPSKARSRTSPKSNTKDRESVEDDAATLKARKNVRFTLGNGSLLVMQGRTQEFWKHEIPKDPLVKTGRISLTFRQLA